MRWRSWGSARYLVRRRERLKLRFEDLASARNLLARMEHASQPVAAPGTDAAPTMSGSPFLEGQTVSIAEAALQQRVGSAVAAAGGNVLSSGRWSPREERRGRIIFTLIASCRSTSPACSLCSMISRQGCRFCSSTSSCYKPPRQSEARRPGGCACDSRIGTLARSEMMRGATRLAFAIVAAGVVFAGARPFPGALSLAATGGASTAPGLLEGGRRPLSSATPSRPRLRLRRRAYPAAERQSALGPTLEEPPGDPRTPALLALAAPSRRGRGGGAGRRGPGAVGTRGARAPGPDARRHHYRRKRQDRDLLQCELAGGHPPAAGRSR